MFLVQEHKALGFQMIGRWIIATYFLGVYLDLRPGRSVLGCMYAFQTNAGGDHRRAFLTAATGRRGTYLVLPMGRRERETRVVTYGLQRNFSPFNAAIHSLTISAATIYCK